MKQVIYGDVYFLINFSMDFLALYLTAKLRHRPEKTWRLAAGASLGGLYATLALVIIPPALDAPLTLAFPFPLTAVAFGFSGFFTLLKDAAAFFAISFAMGGVMTAAYYLAARFLASREIYINGSVETLYSDLPLWLLALTAALAALISYLWAKHCKKAASRRTVSLVIGDRGHELTLSAMCDSGNLLEEPIGHLPVIVLGKEAMLSLLPPSLSRAFFDKDLAAERVDPRYLTRLRFIPVSTVGHEGLLRGYIPDYVTIGGEKKRACVALDEENGDFGGFEAIVPSSLL